MTADSTDQEPDGPRLPIEKVGDDELHPDPVLRFSDDKTPAEHEVLAFLGMVLREGLPDSIAVDEEGNSVEAKFRSSDDHLELHLTNGSIVEIHARQTEGPGLD